MLELIQEVIAADLHARFWRQHFALQPIFHNGEAMSNPNQKKLDEALEHDKSGAPHPRLDDGVETRPSQTEAAPLAPIGPGPARVE
jgi:hypothetical protein